MSPPSPSPPSAGQPHRPNPTRLLAAIKQLESLSSAPAILAKAMDLLQRGEPDVDHIAELLRGDPALAAETLRISNSAYYGSGLKATSIGYALQKIGYREAIRLLNLSVTRVLTHKDLVCYGITAEDFWRESLFHGLLMEELSRAVGQGEPEEAYTSGLLRYLGRRALDQTLQELGGELRWTGEAPLLTWETQTVGLSQAKAGAALLKQWQFSEVLVAACEAQVRPAQLRVPNWYATALHFTESLLPRRHGQPFVPSLGEVGQGQFMKEHHLRPEDLAMVFTDTLAAYERVLGSYG